MTTPEASPLILVGLGNPGSKYTHTRHNIGFDLLDTFCHYHNLTWHDKKDVFLAKGLVDNQEIRAVKPSTYMNRSGPPLAKQLRNLPNPHNLIVIHDDLDLPLGRVKIKYGGSSGGHKGLDSLDATIGREYWRMRVGIDRPEQQSLVERYVLTKLSALEQRRLKAVFDSVPHLVDCAPFTQQRFAQFLTNLNARRDAQIAA